MRRRLIFRGGDRIAELHDDNGGPWRSAAHHSWPVGERMTTDLNHMYNSGDNRVSSWTDDDIKWIIGAKKSEIRDDKGFIDALCREVLDLREHVQGVGRSPRGGGAYPGPWRATALTWSIILSVSSSSALLI